MRRPHRQSCKRKAHAVTGMVMIGERPAEAADRVVPGHGEGDLIIGKDGKSAIATPVERSTRYVMLALPSEDHSAAGTRDALVEAVTSLPPHLDTVATEPNGRPRKTLGWETPAERLTKLLAATS